nr:hypothetical protein I308_02336 [Cryptococcus tetragattii IND107]
MWAMRMRKDLNMMMLRRSGLRVVAVLWRELKNHCLTRMQPPARYVMSTIRNFILHESISILAKISVLLEPRTLEGDVGRRRRVVGKREDGAMGVKVRVGTGRRWQGGWKRSSLVGMVVAGVLRASRRVIWCERLVRGRARVQLARGLVRVRGYRRLRSDMVLV